MTPLFERLTTAADLDNYPADKLAERKKATQARLNSQKSTGPTTPEGKAKSALNARRHGYSGASVVVADEDLPAYNAHLDSYFASFAPQTQAECDTIRRAAIAMWRADRLTSIETGILDIETLHATDMIEVALSDYDLHHKLAYSFMNQTATEGQTALALCMRYLTAANRDFDRAIRTFYLMKENRIPETASAPLPETGEPAPPPSEETPTPNEPTANRPPIPFPATKPATSHAVVAQTDSSPLPRTSKSSRGKR